MLHESRDVKRPRWLSYPECGCRSAVDIVAGSAWQQREPRKLMAAAFEADDPMPCLLASSYHSKRDALIAYLQDCTSLGSQSPCPRLFPGSYLALVNVLGS